VRINAQLIDAETDRHLWADRFDRDVGDLFALQNEITERIAVALNLELVAAEAARPTDNPDSLDYILQGRAARLKPASRNVYAEAISLFERALMLDPQSAEAQSSLANALVDRVLDEMTDSAAADISRAQGLAGQALAASPRNALARLAEGTVLRGQRRCAEAIPEFETVLALDRNSVGALAGIGRCKIYIGPIDQGIAAEEQAIRLSPRDPSIWIWYFRIGEGHLLQSKIDEAISWARKGAKRQSCSGLRPCLSRIRLCPQRRDRTRRRRTGRGAQAGRRGLLSEHGSNEPCTLRGPNHPCPSRGNLLCRPAQGRSAGGMNRSGARHDHAIVAV
jgi:tetratricopeptide (TPR) repeat protein